MVNLLTEFRFSNQNMLRSERQSSVQPEFDRNRYPVLSSLAILMDQLARHVGGRSKYRRFFSNSLLNRSVI